MGLQQRDQARILGFEGGKGLLFRHGDDGQDCRGFQNPYLSVIGCMTR